jgi:hypothetical protein
MSKIIKGFGVLSLMVAPFMALAGGSVSEPTGTEIGGNTIFNLLGIISAIMNTVIPILITLAVLYTIWGVIKYATAKEAEDQAEGRRVIITGIIGLFVIVSIWGLVAVLNSTFGINQGGTAVDQTGACSIVGYNSQGFPIWSDPSCI